MSENQIFREEALQVDERSAKSGDYVKVATPRLWLVLAGIVLLLLGFICWGFLGRIEVTESAFRVDVVNGISYFYVVKTHDGMYFQNGAKATIAGYEGEVVQIASDAVPFTKITDITGLEPAAGQEDAYVYLIQANVPGISDGTYFWGSVVTEIIAPMSFVFN